MWNIFITVPAARQTIGEALQARTYGRRERLVRINPVGSEFFESDLRATIAAGPDGYVLPKVEFAEQVQAVAEFLSLEEKARGRPAGGIKLLPIV